MIRALRGLARLVLTLAVVLLVAAALLSASLRFLVPSLDRWHAEIESLASDALGQPVRVGRVHAELHGLDPSLRIDGLRIETPDGKSVALEAAGLWLIPDVLASIAAGRPVLEWIELRGVALSVNRLSDGTIRVAGVSGAAPGADSAAGPGLEWIGGLRRVRVADSVLHYQDYRLRGHPLAFRQVELDIVNEADRHRASGRLSLPAEWGGSVRVELDMQGSLVEPAGRRSTLYAEAAGVQLPGVLEFFLAGPPSLAAGEFGARVWTRWEDGHLRSALGDLAVERLAGASATGGESFSARFDLDRDRDAGRWHARVLGAPRVAGAEPVRAELEYREAMGGPRASLRAALRDLSVASAAAIAPQAFAAIGADVAPGGMLEELLISVEAAVDGDIDVDWAVAGRVRDLGFDSRDRRPAARGVDARFWAGPRAGRVELDSTGVALDFPKVFDGALALDALRGELVWRRDADGALYLNASDIDARSGAMTVSARAYVEHHAGEPAQLDLQARAAGADQRRLADLLPVHIMHPNLVNWLRSSIRAGHSDDVRVLVHGPLRGFPYESGGGRFQVLATVDDVQLVYRPEWPAIEKATALLDFDNNAMTIRLADGQTHGHAIASATARIERLKPVTPLLIHGRTAGTVSDAIGFLHASPLRERIGRFIAESEFEGSAKVDLNLEIPLVHDIGETHVNGHVDVDGGRLHNAAAGLTVDAIAGRLAFNRQGVAADALAVRVFDLPAIARFDARAVDRLPEITLHGQVGAGRLGRLLGPLGGQLSGQTDWVAHVGSGDADDGPVRIAILSDLRGLAADLPPPFGKRADDVVASEALLRWQPHTREGRLRVDTGRDVHLTAVLQGAEDGALAFERGNLRLGAEPIEPAEPGLLVDGQVDSFVLGDWLDRLAAAPDANESAEPDGAQPVLRRVALRSAQLGVPGGGRFEDAQFELERAGQGWTGSVDGPRLAGRFDVPDRADNARPVRIVLERLDLRAAEDTPVGAGAVAAEPPDPARATPFRLDVAALSHAGRAMGRLEVDAHRADGGLEFATIRLDGQALQLSGQGRWTGAGDAMRTSLRLRASGEDIGQVLRQFGYAQTLTGARFEADIDSAVAGPPAALALTALNGTVDLRLREGRIPSVDPGVGRVFGLLNLGTIGKRLTLDFRDLFESGLRFDRIDGRFTLAEGDAYTNDLRIEGPNAGIEITGRVGLLARDYDETVTVTPNLGLSLPLVGVAAGGPAVGAAVWLAQSVLGRPVERIARFRYEVTGPWDEPVIERVSAHADQNAADDAPGQ
ncbi:MAG: TIGR02099 family protein [Chromatiales bacterium]|nr:TIGR02099 family protein [Chromatiales bacterium]